MFLVGIKNSKKIKIKISEKDISLNKFNDFFFRQLYIFNFLKQKRF